MPRLSLLKTVRQRWFGSSIVCYRFEEAVGMAEVTDPNDVKWSVDRRWWIFDPLPGGGNTGIEGLVLGFVLAILLMVLLWPVSLVVHWLGVPWAIVIERDGKRVGKERVRGWNESGRRVQEIAESVAAGAWRPVDGQVDWLTGATPPPRTGLYLYGGAGYASPIAQLELTDRTMRCTVKGKSGYARWLSKRLEIPDLKKHLNDGQQVTVFELPRYGCEIRWPEWVPPGACLQVRRGDGSVWSLAFIEPGRRPAESEYQKLAGTCQQWRAALGPGGVQH
jgi:hypothetical protein